MIKLTNILFTSLLVVFISCSSQSPKIIAQQKTGDKVVMITSNEGTITKGAGNFYIEIHNASDNSFIDVGGINADAKMPVPDKPMSGEVTVAKTEIPGRYKATYNFAMSGKWTLNVHFGVIAEAQFVLDVN